jgi:hypothetical protein
LSPLCVGMTPRMNLVAAPGSKVTVEVVLG